jgi:hypothetical protein
VTGVLIATNIKGRKSEGKRVFFLITDLKTKCQQGNEIHT